MKAAPDPGYRDPDNSAGFSEMLASLDHFNTAPYIRAARRELYRLLNPRHGSRLLDAGCGTGLDVAALASKVSPEGLVVGLDISRRFLEVACKRYSLLPGVEFYLGNVEHLGFRDNQFDGAFAMRVLQYMSDPNIALRELVRVVRPGARVVIVEGGMSAVDLPDSDLSRAVFGPKAGFGIRLPGLLRQAGLERIILRPAFDASLGKADPKVIDYAHSVVAGMVQSGAVSSSEAESWVADLDSRVAAQSWFSVDCVFVVAGRVPAQQR